MTEKRKFYIPYGKETGTLFYGVESDSVDVYLRWVKEVPRLSFEEEERLHFKKKSCWRQI